VAKHPIQATVRDFEYDDQGGITDYTFTISADTLEDELNVGPYITLLDYFEGFDIGAFGPDEDCRWVSIAMNGTIQETPITYPHNAPPRTIAVAYYAA
jgi:hypothetical protein